MYVWGSLFLLLSILSTLSTMGSTDFDTLLKLNLEYKTQIFLLIGIFIAFAVKTPTIFFNNWLLKAHVESPLGGSIVLAGITMLALNLVICWEGLKRSISRKLFAEFSCFNSTLRENNTLNLENIDCESNIKLNRILRGHTLDTTNISSYLAGLIEGEGCIYVPKITVGAATVSIIFNSKDLPLPLLIQKELRIGNIYKVKGKNAYSYTISNIEGLIKITNLINGYMRTPKINKLYELIDWINLKNKKIIISEKFSIDNSCLSINAWLSGFIDADGCFYVRVTRNKNCTTNKVACLFELAQKTTDKNSMLEIITKISEFLSTRACLSSGSVKFRKKSNQLWIRTSNYESNKILVLYLNKYSLFSSKYLDFLSWQTILNIMIKKEQVNKLEVIRNIKNNMNSKRTHFAWDHLQNFYSY